MFSWKNLWAAPCGKKSFINIHKLFCLLLSFLVWAWLCLTMGVAPLEQPHSRRFVGVVTFPVCSVSVESVPLPLFRKRKNVISKNLPVISHRKLTGSCPYHRHRRQPISTTGFMAVNCTGAIHSPVQATAFCDSLSSLFGLSHPFLSKNQTKSNFT